MQSHKIKKGGNSNLIDCNAIAQKIIKLELPPYFKFCTIALQSIKLELPPFFILCDCIAIYEIGVTSLFYFARLHCNLLNWSYIPFFASRKIKKGGNSNLIDCNTITQNIKGGYIAIY
jgi:hypothetical protein